jgi:hypothetical protein
MREEKVIIDCINIAYIVWAIVTILTYAIGVDVPFIFILPSFYRIFTLAIIGAIITKSEKDLLFMLTLTVILLLTGIVLVEAVIALLKNDIAVFILGVLAFVVGIVKSYIDCRRGK